MSPETGAHLTDVISKRSPSLLEILSQQNLASGLHSAFQHLTKVLASEQPERFRWLYRSSDEIYLLINAAIQYHYLRTRGGTLSETFYGMQRIPSSSNATASRAAQLALVELLFPYCETKIGKIVQGWSTGLEQERDHESDRDRTADALKYYYRVMGILILLKFYYFVMYILNKSKSHSVIFALFGWRLVYSNSNPEGLGLHLKSWRYALFLLGETVLPVIELGSFFMQFLNWWNLEKRRELDIKPVPEPPTDMFNLDKYHCPICNQPRRNSAALRTSGIVYCYGCISKYLQQERKCPISGIPSSTQDLVRVYS